ncbi:MAG: DUF4139 domain-containing protein [Gammaproteobacteria bacterium]
MKPTLAKPRLKTLLTLVTFCISTVAAASNTDEERRTTLEDQTALAVTIYNQDLALIKDRRRLSLAKGETRLAIRDVSAKIRPETALLKSLSRQHSFIVLEQNFDFDLLSPQTLLAKYVGEEIRVATMNPATGKEGVESATVLSNNNGLVLRYADRIETGAAGRLIFDRLPARLRDRPTLVTTLNSRAAGQRQVELSYLTGGLSWQADYIAQLNQDDSLLDLQGWVTLTNQSGTRYPDSKLQLVAGDLNRVTGQQIGRFARKEAMMAMAADHVVAEETLFEYHLYTIPRATTLENNQTKQVALLAADRVPVRKQLLLSGNGHYYRGQYADLGQKLKVAVLVEFDNDKQSHLGIPLPKGVVRVYKQDSAGHAQFVGEDRIDHTPKKRPVKLKLGNAFDVTADRLQTSYAKRRASGRYSQASESAYKITLHNAKTETVTVTVRENMSGDWKILDENLDHKKVAAHRVEWQVKVPAEGQTHLTYRVLTRY